MTADPRQDPATRPARSDANAADLPPRVSLDPPAEIEVRADGEWWPGTATAYRGRRISVPYSRGIGLNHMTWVPADQVRRV